MITPRKFFVVLLALTALVVLVVASYSAYEMTPERRGPRVAARLERLGDELIVENPKEGIRKEYYKRIERLQEELFEIACRCGLPVDRYAELVAHKKECLFHKLFSEVLRHWAELEEKLREERWGRALEESRQ